MQNGSSFVGQVSAVAFGVAGVWTRQPPRPLFFRLSYFRDNQTIPVEMLKTDDSLIFRFFLVCLISSTSRFAGHPSIALSTR